MSARHSRPPQIIGLSDVFISPSEDMSVHLFLDGLAMVLNADGFGTRELKTAKYHAFTSSPRRFFGEGFKLFYREDTKLMTPRQVLRLRPPPDVVVYE